MACAALLIGLAGACGEVVEDEPEFLMPGYCFIRVEGVGDLDIEDDYLPHVVACENDGAGPEALRAQAVAARSYAYYKIGESGSVVDGQGDQVYTCSRPPRQEHYDAVDDTRFELLAYQDVVVAAFYVAGAVPSDEMACVAVSGDSDPTNTERFVTYNQGASGDDVEQTTLGWVHPENWANRGCMSQWGSRCIDKLGVGYDEILRFYYGEDIVRAEVDGSCADGAALTAAPRRARRSIWRPEMRIGR